MFSQTVSLLLLAFASQALGQQIAPGVCPVVAAVENFDISTMLGQWYEVKRYEIEAIPEVDCVEGTYAEWNETYILVDARGKNFSNDGENLHYTGRLHEEYPGDNVGVVNLVIDGQPLEEILYLLDFDPSAYSVSWSCYYFPEVDVNVQYLWVHARERSLTPEQEITVEEVITSYGLDYANVRNTIQDPAVCVFPKH